MATKRRGSSLPGRAPSLDPARHRRTSPAQATAEDERKRSATSTPPVVGAETLRFASPCCGANALDITRKPNKYDGRTLGTFLHCKACEGGLNEVHAATGIPKTRLLEWPPPDELGPRRRGSRSGADAAPTPLPSIGSLSGWADRLGHLESYEAFRFLTERRGLSKEVIRAAGLGYDGAAITIPVRDKDDQLVNLRRRFLDSAADPKILPYGRGHGTQLYSVWPRIGSGRAVVLCEGELDCLALLSRCIPAITTTAGVGHWKPEWSAEFRGRQVAVVFDADAVHVARLRVSQLLAAAAREAWVVDLSRAGLRGKQDVTDLVVGQAWDGPRLREFINRERRREIRGR